MKEMCPQEAYEKIRVMHERLHVFADSWDQVREHSPTIVARIEEIEGMDTSSMPEQKIREYSFALFKNYGVALDRFHKKREVEKWKKEQMKKN